MRNGRTNVRLVFLAAGLVIVLGAPPAAAQQPPPAEPPAPAQDEAAVREQARTHFSAAQDAWNAEDWETALREYRAANELLPASRALSLIAQCQRKLGRSIDALTTFRRYVELYGEPANDRERAALAEVRDWIEEIRDIVGTVAVNVAVSGATVLVDGHVVGTAPLGQPVELVRGPHAFRAEAPGYRPAEESITVEAGAQTTVTLVPVPQQTTASVSLSSNVPGAVATLDGEELGPLPFSGDAQPGVHQLEVSAEGYETMRLAITLEAGQPFNRSVDLVAVSADGEPWYEKWWVWTIAGVVVGGAVTGIVLGATGGDTMPASDWTVPLD